LWHPARPDPDYDRLLMMLQLAQGQPIKPYQLAKEVLYREPPLPGDEFSHMRRLGTKLKQLLALAHELLTEDGEDGPWNTEDLKRLTAMKIVRYLMDPKDPWGRPRAEKEAQRGWANEIALAELGAARLRRRTPAAD
jgi:hypothetical protein